jgi:hypothetical protein
MPRRVERVRRDQDHFIIGLDGDAPVQRLCPPAALGHDVLAVHDHGVPADTHSHNVTDEFDLIGTAALISGRYRSGSAGAAVNRPQAAGLARRC